MFNTLCKWSWSKTFSSLLPQSSVLPVPNTTRLELQMWSWPLSQWVHMTWRLSPVVHTFQGSPLSGPDILEFPRWTLKLDFYSGNPAQIPCFQDTVFVSKHVVPPFSQSLKSTIDYLKSVLAACPNSRWSEMWVLPLSQLHPVYNPKDYQSVILWNIHWTYLFYNKNGQETEANRRLVTLEESMHYHDDKPTMAVITETCIPAEAVYAQLRAIAGWWGHSSQRTPAMVVRCDRLVIKLHFLFPVLSLDKITIKLLFTWLWNVVTKVTDLFCLGRYS